MAILLERHLMAALPELRFQPTPKRVRVELGGVSIADTTRAMLIWEPMRIVPSYAVPEHDLSATLTPAQVGPPPEHRDVRFGADGPPLLDPSVPFTVHTASGEPCTVEQGASIRPGSAFRLTDAPLDGYVVLEFDAFDWFEEDVALVGHPRDPFHRIDVRESHRPVRIEQGGHVLAASDRPVMLFEATFPVVRYYLPRDDLNVELRPGSRNTVCAYKGRATHYSVHLDDEVLRDVAWSYEDPLDDAARVQGLVSFYTERLDVFVDDELLERVRTPWS